MQMSPQICEASGGQNYSPDSSFAPGALVLPVAIHEEHSRFQTFPHLESLQSHSGQQPCVSQRKLREAQSLAKLAYQALISRERASYIIDKSKKSL